MLKLKLQHFGHLMRRTDSFGKTLVLGKIEGRRRRGQQRMIWLHTRRCSDWSHSGSLVHSVSQLDQSLSRFRLCQPMDYNMPGSPVHRQLLEPTHIHVHTIGNAIQPSHSVFPFTSCLQSFPASGSFPMSQFFASGSQSIGVSASASVLPMNIQD